MRWKNYAFLGRFAVAVLLGFALSAWLNFLPNALSGKVDFRHLYTAGYLLRTGQRHLLYDQTVTLITQRKLVSAWHGYPSSLQKAAFNHLAYEAIFFAPLSLIPYRAAYFCFTLLNVLLLAACARFLALMLPQAEIGTICAGLLPLFLPLYFVLADGQDSFLLLMTFVVALWGLNQGQEGRAGLVLGLGLFKFQFILPVGFLFLCWKRWRFCVGLFISSCAILAASIWLVGWGESVSYFRDLLGMGTSSSGRAMYGIQPADMPNLRGLVFGLWGEHPRIVLGLSLAVLAMTWLKMKKASLPSQFAASSVAAVLVSYHCLSYDWSVLLPAVVISLVARGFSRVLVIGAFVASSLLFVAKLFPLASLPLLAFLFCSTHDAFNRREQGIAEGNGKDGGTADGGIAAMEKSF